MSSRKTQVSARHKLVEVVVSAFQKWQQNNANIKAAAIAFFIILPLPSLLLIIVAIYEQFYGVTAGIYILIQQIEAIAGSTIASLISDLLQSTSSPFTTLFGSIWTVIFTATGAIGAFFGFAGHAQLHLGGGSNTKAPHFTEEDPRKEPSRFSLFWDLQ